MLKRVEIDKVINDLVRSKVNAITGRVLPEDLLEETLPEARKLCAGFDLLRELLRTKFDAELGRRMRALADPAEQLDLFAKQQCEEQFIRYEDGTVSRMALATYDQIYMRREEQIKNWRHAATAFEREERVREKVMALMKQNPTMTFEQACKLVGLF